MSNVRIKLKVKNQVGMAAQVGYSPEALSHFNTPHDLDSGPGLIVDIWKKFELIPTPPLSPSRQTASSGASSPTCFTNSPADTLQSVSDILDVDCARPNAFFADHSCPNLKSKLIQDCMWGSHSNDKYQRARFVEDVYDTPCSTPPPFLGLDYISADCVDPSSVFSYPLNQQEFASDSSSSSEDEIDVVTIEKPVIKRKPECLKTKSDVEPAAKRSKTVHKNLRVVRDTQISAREVSTRLAAKEKVEDPECKRTVHNVLERKRRNDLKYSFQLLRDSVPELKGSERTPKVAILKKATDCIHNLRTQEESLLKQKDTLEKRHQSLLRKLNSLEEES